MRARRLWHAIEPVNAVTYFSPECLEASTALGLQGFWMGYFGCRAAPLGPAGPAIVEATFFNFHPDRVRRAIPDAWERASPEQLLQSRATAAAAALRRLLPDGAAEHLAASTVDPLRRAMECASAAGRPLFGANREVAVPADPVAALWQATTTAREHRGDGHVALLTAAGLGGCEAHALATSVGHPGSADPDLYQRSRGWSPDDWSDATDRLRSRGLVDRSGRATAAGRDLHGEIEHRTDQLADEPFSQLPEPTVDILLEHLEQAAPAVATDLRFPNPMGLPGPDGSAT